MKRSNGPKRKKRLRRTNTERKKALFEKQYGNDDYVAALHKEGCQIPDCRPTSGSRSEIQCDHTPTRAAGGTWRQMVPLCLYHHRLKHDVGVESFQAFYGIDLDAIATAMVLQHGHLVTGEPPPESEEPEDWHYEYELED